MSTALYHNIGGLRFWSEAEIDFRELAQREIVRAVKASLIGINRAWSFERVEGPQLTPRDFISAEYADRDLWITNATLASQAIALRAETTASTYAVARSVQGRKLPACFWQAGKSFRAEANDGASAAKLRFYEFWQLEMQCIYRLNTIVDYRAQVLPTLADHLSWLTRAETRIVESDRLPSYSQSTMDVEAMYQGGWKEIASVSIRTDYAADTLVLEVAVGLDRVVAVHFS